MTNSRSRPSALAVLPALVALAWQEPQEHKGGAPDQDEPRDKNAERVILPRDKHPLLFMELTLTNPDPATPMLVLYHEARSSKGEYRPITPHLRELGYNCLAVDLCTGGTCRDVKNNTARKASEKGRNTTYLDTLPDILDSLQWARTNHAHGKLIAWGSSFSAALVFVVAAEHLDLVDGVVAFSPGEYFTALGKSEGWVQDSAKKLQGPVFVAAAAGEEHDWKPIFDAVPSATKASFLPDGPGAHGSRALWDESPGHEQYWAALEAFLKQSFPAPVAPVAPATPGAPAKDH